MWYLLALIHASLSDVLYFKRSGLSSVLLTLWSTEETFDGKGIGALYLMEIFTAVNIWEPGGNVQII